MNSDLKKLGDLRQRAEQFLKANPEETPSISTVEVQQLFHELDVNQIALIMQNEELHESEERFRLFMDNSPTIAWIKDDQGRHVYLSKTYEDRFGVRLEDWRGKTDAEVWPAEIAATFRRNDQAVLDAGHAIEVVEETINPDGSRCYWLNVKFPFHDAAGTRYVAGIGLDITKRKLAEEAKRLSEMRYRILFDSIDEGFCIVEVIFNANMKPIDYRILEINPSFERQTGLVNAQGKRIRELVPENEEYWYETYGRIALTGQPERFQKQTEKLGRWFDVYAFRFGQPKDRQVAIIFKDITAQKKTENALRDSEKALAQLNRELELRVKQRTAELGESEERYHRLFEAESDAILIFDGETRRFIDVNDAAVKQYGYAREEFLQLTQYDITAEPEASDATIREALKGGLSTIPLRLHRKKDGTVFPVEIARCSFVWKGRTMLCGVARDISERIAREEELQHLASELSLAEQRERQRIVAVLHDDISQLLSSAHLRLQSIETDSLSEASKRSLETTCCIIDKALKQTRSLTFELSCPMLNELGLSAALDELCKSMSREHGILFVFKGGKEPLTLNRDTQLVLYRSARELMINVMKHSEAKQAFVELEHLDDTLRIRVSDDGKGFDDFKAGTGFAHSGGFGLFNIREYLRHVDGSLSIESITGDGTCVEVKVPLEKQND